MSVSIRAKASSRGNLWIMILDESHTGGTFSVEEIESEICDAPLALHLIWNVVHCHVTNHLDLSHSHFLFSENRLEEPQLCCSLSEIGFVPFPLQPIIKYAGV